MKEYTFTPKEAIEICQQVVPADCFEETAAWQYLIDTGIAWRHEDKWFASIAKRLIDDGYCTFTDRAKEEQS